MTTKQRRLVVLQGLFIGEGGVDVPPSLWVPPVIIPRS